MCFPKLSFESHQSPRNFVVSSTGEVSISGARPELCPHLAMAGPETVQDLFNLFKLAVVANEGLVAEANLHFEALNVVSEQLQQFEWIYSHENGCHSHTES